MQQQMQSETRVHIYVINCLNSYEYETAHLLSSFLYAKNPSEKNLFLVATVYYRQNKLKMALNILNSASSHLLSYYPNKLLRLKISLDLKLTNDSALKNIFFLGKMSSSEKCIRIIHDINEHNANLSQYEHYLYVSPSILLNYLALHYMKNDYSMAKLCLMLSYSCDKAFNWKAHSIASEMRNNRSDETCELLTLGLLQSQGKQSTMRSSSLSSKVSDHLANLSTDTNLNNNSNNKENINMESNKCNTVHPLKRKQIIPTVTQNCCPKNTKRFKCAVAPKIKKALFLPTNALENASKTHNDDFTSPADSCCTMRDAQFSQNNSNDKVRENGMLFAPLIVPNKRRIKSAIDFDNNGVVPSMQIIPTDSYLQSPDLPTKHDINVDIETKVTPSIRTQLYFGGSPLKENMVGIDKRRSQRLQNKFNNHANKKGVTRLPLIAKKLNYQDTQVAQQTKPETQSKKLTSLNTAKTNRSLTKVQTLDRECQTESNNSIGVGNWNEVTNFDHVENSSFIGEMCGLLNRLSIINNHLTLYEIDEALLQIELIPAEYMNSPCVLSLYGRLFYEKRDFKKACEMYGKLHEKYPHYLDGLEYYSTCLWHTKNAYELSTLALHLTSEHRSESITWCVAGNCSTLSGDAENAVLALKRAIQINPEMPYAYTILGHEYIMMENLELAQVTFHNAIKLAPMHYNAWFGLALVSMKEENYPKAEAYLKQVISINANYALFYCLLGHVYYQTRDYGKAMENLDKSLAIDPKQILARYYKAQLLLKIRQPNQALKLLKELLRTEQSESKIFHLVANAYEAMGKRIECLKYLDFAATIESKNHIGIHGIGFDGSNELVQDRNRVLAYMDDKYNGSTTKAYSFLTTPYLDESFKQNPSAKRKHSESLLLQQSKDNTSNNFPSFNRSSFIKNHSLIHAIIPEERETPKNEPNTYYPKNTVYRDDTQIKNALYAHLNHIQQFNLPLNTGSNVTNKTMLENSQILTQDTTGNKLNVIGKSKMIDPSNKMNEIPSFHLSHFSDVTNTDHSISHQVSHISSHTHSLVGSQMEIEEFSNQLSNFKSTCSIPNQRVTSPLKSPNKIQNSTNNMSVIIDEPGSSHFFNNSNNNIT